MKHWKKERKAERRKIIKGRLTYERKKTEKVYSEKV
jgi:hypothetical protein